MRRTLLILALLAGSVTASPALADDDDLPQFPKIAPPDPLPDAACDAVAAPLEWGLGDWIAAPLRIHVEKTAWTIAGGPKPLSGKTVSLEPCTIDLIDDQGSIFAGVRAEDGHLYAALWTDDGKVRRLNFKRP